jgi:hypothetical protein
MKQNYAQLPEEEKEKDRVVARVLLQAITGGQQGVAEGYAIEDEQVNGMAQGEIREIIRNAVKIKEKLDSGTSLDGWMYSYVTTSNDRLNSVAEQIGNPNIDEQGVSEGGYNDYNNNRKGFSRPGREDDEYHVPDPVETQYNIKVNGEVINQQPFANRAEALTWAKQAVAAGKLDPKNAKLSPINQVNELSNDKLASYKKAAGADATAADKRGDFEHGNKRFRGIVKATIKQGDNDVKKHKVNELSKGTLAKYARANADDQVQHASSQSFQSGLTAKEQGRRYNDADAWDRRTTNREKGLDRALNKLSRE